MDYASDIRAVSTYTDMIKEGNILHSNVDVKHRLKAHVVLRRSLLPDCVMGEIITRSNIFVAGGGYDITMRDIRGLQKGRWINDVIVDVVMAGIQSEARTIRGVRGDMYITSQFYSMILDPDQRTARKVTNNIKVDEGGRLFTVVNTRNASHWVAVEIHFQKKIVTIMDSIRPRQGDDEYVELEMISKNLQKWADTEAKPVLEGKGGPVSTLGCLNCTAWMFDLCNRCPQQTNGWDCGLFALASVAARSRGATRHSISDMNEQRIILAAWIISIHNNNEVK
jgi:Ulp1 family protease